MSNRFRTSTRSILSSSPPEDRTKEYETKYVDGEAVPLVRVTQRFVKVIPQLAIVVIALAMTGLENAACRLIIRANVSPALVPLAR